ncbi:hypothetical protein FRC11_011700, partial [Ceratobasidium sp. 423]
TKSPDGPNTLQTCCPIRSVPDSKSRNSCGQCTRPRPAALRLIKSTHPAKSYWRTIRYGGHDWMFRGGYLYRDVSGGGNTYR